MPTERDRLNTPYAVFGKRQNENVYIANNNRIWKRRIYLASSIYSGGSGYNAIHSDIPASIYSSFRPDR